MSSRGLAVAAAIAAMAWGAAVPAISYPVALAGAFLAVCWAASMAACS
jgi:hypothetical protein